MGRHRMLASFLALALGAAHGQGTPRVPNVFLVGDLAPNAANSFNGTAIHVRETIVAGETTRGFIRSGAWDRVLAQVQPGDFVVLDFAADSVQPQDRAEATRTLAGFGDGTFDYLDPGTGKLELVHSYGWYLRRMVVDVINHGATPLLCAGPATVQPGAGDWARYIATEQRIPVVSVDQNGSGLLNGLRTAAPDPLAPYLADQSR